MRQRSEPTCMWHFRPGNDISVSVPIRDRPVILTLAHYRLMGVIRGKRETRGLKLVKDSILRDRIKEHIYL